MRTLISFIIFITVSCGAVARAQDEGLTPEQWREDIAFVVETLERVHPMAFARADEAAFRAHVEQLRSMAETASPEQLTLELMRLTARLEDGHTVLDASPMEPFASSWYPLRFYLFEDGVYLTAVGAEHAALVGARIETIGESDAREALMAASALMGAENEFDARERIYWASNAAVMRALGFAEADGALRMSLVDQTGAAREATISPLDQGGSLGWRFWGENHPPVATDAGSVAWGGHASDSFWRADETIPLFLRDRRPYHIDVLEDEGVVYFQFNAVMRDFRDDSFEAAYGRVFDALDADPTRRLVLDIRFNFGGDGSILQPFVHEVIRRPRLMESGALIVITGRQTFSAGVNLLSALVEHVDPVLVGEPAGAGHNAFGNAETFVLPNSRMELSVSAVLHVGTGWSEQPGEDQRLVPVDFHTPMTGADYFAGRDPAMALILSGRDLRSLEAIAAMEDAETLRSAFDDRMAAYGDLDWWRATGMWEMNAAGNELLRAGRNAEDPELIERAVAALQINTEVYPEWWNSWDSLAEAHMAAGRNEEAMRLYEHSLELNPGNDNARHMIAELREGSEE